MTKTRSDETTMGTHLIDGQFQSDKYPTCPRGKVPLSVTDPTAQDLLWEYAQRRRAIDAEFSDDLEAALTLAGYKPGADGVQPGEIIKAHVGIDAVGWEVGVDFGAAGMSGGTGHANQWTSWPAILLTDGKKLVESHFTVYGHKNNAGRLLTSTMGENPPNIEQACKLLSDRINEAREDRRSRGDRDEATKTVPHRSGVYIRVRGGFFIYFCAGCGADLINVGRLSRPTWQAVDADNSHIENGTVCDPVPDGTLPLPARDGLLYVAALMEHMPKLEAEIADIERRMSPEQKAVVSVLPESLNLRGPQVMSRPRFLLDIDGVCADFLGAALPILHELTGKLYTPDDFPTWDLFDTIHEKYEAPFYERCRRAGFCMGIRPYPGAVAGVAAIHEVANVRVVTSPIHGDAWYFERAEWCAIHLGVIPKHVIHKSEKETEHGDYLLDDKPAHVAAWAKAHPSGMGLLWSQPYNKSHVFPGWLENVRRVSTWAEVEQIVRSSYGD